MAPRSGLSRRQAPGCQLQRGERRLVETRSWHQAIAADRYSRCALQVVEALARRTIETRHIFCRPILTTKAKLLVQACFDRWQIEVNHRDEKDILGVGQAQVRSEHSVPRHPALAVASYSLLMLAALRELGPGRTADYVEHPRWRKPSKRASFLDMVTLLRRESNEASVSQFLNHDFAKNLTLYADT